MENKMLPTSTANKSVKPREPRNMEHGTWNTRKSDFVFFLCSVLCVMCSILRAVIPIKYRRREHRSAAAERSRHPIKHYVHFHLAFISQCIAAVIAADLRFGHRGNA